MTAPSITAIYPANEATGIVLSSAIEVTFDREIDTTTIQVILEGPDNDRWTGPEMVRWDNPATDQDDNVLESPGYHGIVPGTLTFEKLDSEGEVVSGEYNDTAGDGTLWKTKVIFTPTYPLAASTTYTVYIPGDEDAEDSYVTGVSTRTVYDTVKGANDEDGDVTFTGGYTGTVADVFHVQVKAAGEAADGLEFQWWKSSSPMTVRELHTKESSQLLSNGVSVSFSGDFAVDDSFTVVVEPAERLTTTYTWTFETGSGSIVTIPDDVEQTPSVPVGGFTSTDDGGTSGEYLQVVSVTPDVRATNLDPDSVEQIIIVFNKDLDAATVTDDAIEVWSEPVNGEFEGNTIEFAGQLVKILSVDGATLTIQIS